MHPKPSTLRAWLGILVVAVLASPPPSLAFDTPLSDQAVREAYFLGQRRDDSMARLLNRYTQFLPAPATGPHVFSVSFLTPFALVIQQSSQRLNYSAQQAAKEHHPDDEIVSISIEILLTPSYGALITGPTGSRSGSPIGIQLRNPDFWKDFKYSVFADGMELKVDSPTGEPTYRCDGDGGCELTGAMVHFQFPAKLFNSGSATVEIDPKVADPASADFDLTRLR
jgi:hypothetical protein